MMHFSGSVIVRSHAVMPKRWFSSGIPASFNQILVGEISYFTSPRFFPKCIFYILKMTFWGSFGLGTTSTRCSVSKTSSPGLMDLNMTRPVAPRPIPGEMIQFDGSHIFGKMGWRKPPTRWLVDVLLDVLVNLFTDDKWCHPEGFVRGIRGNSTYSTFFVGLATVMIERLHMIWVQYMLT